VSSYRSLAPDLERIRDRLRAMRKERDAAMGRLAASREHAEAHRHGVAAPPQPEAPEAPPGIPAP
jgi:hypothetical protein